MVGPPLLFLMDLQVWGRELSSHTPVAGLLGIILSVLFAASNTPRWISERLSLENRMVLLAVILPIFWVSLGFLITGMPSHKLLIRFLVGLSLAQQIAILLAPLVLLLVGVELLWRLTSALAHLPEAFPAGFGLSTPQLLRQSPEDLRHSYESLWTGFHQFLHRVLRLLLRVSPHPRPEVDSEPQPAKIPTSSSPLVLSSHHQQACCPFCGDSLSLRSVVLCSRCETPHHEECWNENPGCTTFACGGDQPLPMTTPPEDQA
jgi:hypothetical protein